MTKNDRCPPRRVLRVTSRRAIGLAAAMMLDLSSDGEPEAFFTTDYNGANAESMHIQLGKLQLSVEQPGATAATSIGTGAMVWQAGPALATALVAAAQKKSSVLPSDLSSIRAIELGCGCSALPSVALAVAVWGLSSGVEM